MNAAAPSVVIQSLIDGSYKSSIKNLSQLAGAINFAQTVRARYVVQQGDPKTALSNTKFTVVQKTSALFTSASVLKAGDTSVSGITVIAISNSGKFIGLFFADATDGLNHVQVWQGS